MTNMIDLPQSGIFLGRVHSPATPHPLVVTVRGGEVIDTRILA